MPTNRHDTRSAASREVISGKIADVLAGIRVPDLPYPAGTLSSEAISDWQPLLASCWSEQRDERVTRVIQSVNLEWSAQQVNAAYVADRIMDVFLKTSGLHPELAGHIARLRFFLAWRMNLEGAGAFDDWLIEWLDSFQEWRGWSDSGGRSSKILLDQLHALVVSVSASFQSQDIQPVKKFCQQWEADAEKRRAQTGKLRQRLLETEQGAARQRRADQTARALIGRALQGRRLPVEISRFIFEQWHSLLKQAVWTSGLEGEAFKHGSKLLEWLVWVGDPVMSDQDRNRLYHVGEQIGDRLVDVWHKVFDTPLPPQALSGIEAVMVARLRGESPDVAEALPEAFDWDSRWLTVPAVDKQLTDEAVGKWYVSGEGAQEQRRYFFALLEDTAEILWTNGAGVKLGLQPWQEFQGLRESGHLRPLPKLTPFGEVLTDTVSLLASVCEKQRKQREEAAQRARDKAETLRREREAFEQQRQQQEAARQAELDRQRQEAEQQRQADEQAEQARQEEARRLVAEKQVAAIKLGGWIVVVPGAPEQEAVRLKLAVRINASRKLVFVDRLGLNRREFQEEALVEAVATGRVRILDSAADFDDTLTRVVGRIRVGKN